MKDLHYEHLNETHAPFIYSIMVDNDYDNIFGEKTTSVDEWRNRINEIITDKGQDNYLAIDKLTNKYIGWIGYETRGIVCMLHIIVIRKEYLSKSYGYTVMKWFIEKIKNKAEKILLDVQKENTRAVHFYLKYGFKIIGEENQLFGDGEKEYYKMELETSTNNN